ncbi:MAG: hypothetical protein K1X67_12620 [Fimbriimonadaceae bacterium]|nr:hypothetical protein [Fimbriimonadaceae bacterium]
MNDFWQTELTEEETQALIQKATDEVAKRRLQSPAVLFLEMNKPLSNIAANATVVFAPFLVPFFGFDAINDVSRLMTKRENIERLIQSIELSAKRPAKENPA